MSSKWEQRQREWLREKASAAEIILSTFYNASPEQKRDLARDILRARAGRRALSPEETEDLQSLEEGGHWLEISARAMERQEKLKNTGVIADPKAIPSTVVEPEWILAVMHGVKAPRSGSKQARRERVTRAAEKVLRKLGVENATQVAAVLTRIGAVNSLADGRNLDPALQRFVRQELGVETTARVMATAPIKEVPLGFGSIFAFEETGLRAAIAVVEGQAASPRRTGDHEKG